MGGGAATDGGFAVPVTGTTGWRGLLENKKALGLATFASLGGVLYGYNQGGKWMYTFNVRAEPEYAQSSHRSRSPLTLLVDSLLWTKPTANSTTKTSSHS